MLGKKVFVHVVLYNSLKQHGGTAIKRTLLALLEQEGFSNGENLQIVVRDNASNDKAVDFLKSEFGTQIKFEALSANFGFAAGQNFGVKDFIESEYDYFLALNPDIRLEKDALKHMLESFKDNIGMVCPRLYRADADLNPIEPLKLDAAGMVLTSTLRHFDRGSEELAEGKYLEPEFVFGASGACVMLSRACVKDLLLDTPDENSSVWQIFPQLKFESERRLPLFDEAFFAYREDADLSWRSQLLGWRCLYQPKACGYHRRVVLPERRKILSAEINRHSVRNRFLLQINNYKLSYYWQAFFMGVLWRNILVICGVILTEHSSFGAFKEVWLLHRRALARRKVLFSRCNTRKRNNTDNV